MNRLTAQIPNLLSGFRVVASFYFAHLVLKNQLWWAFFLFATAALTDFLDGFFARKFNIVSDFGKMLDPLADKFLMFTSYSIFAYVSFIPLWTTVIVVARDALILFIVFLCKILNIALKISPLFSSKINTAVQLIFVIIILLSKCFEIEAEWLVIFGSITVCISTFYSSFDYFRNYYWIKDAICKPETRQ